MIYQQYKTAIKQSYAEHEDVADMVNAAASARQWLASLAIDPKLRDPLVEQIAAIEEAFQDLLTLRQGA